MPRPMELQKFPAAWRYALFIHPIILSRFNRVDGVVHSLSLHGREPRAYDRPPVFELDTRIDVHSTDLPQYDVRGGKIALGAHLPMPGLGQLHGWWGRLEAAYVKETTSPDDWIVGDVENTLAAATVKSDYKNYYLEEGVTLHAATQLIPPSEKATLSLGVTWQSVRQSPLAVATDWSLFSVDRPFRPNIQATPGHEHRLRVALGFHGQDAPRLPFRSVDLDLALEKAGGDLGGDFDYDGVFGAFHARQRTWGDQWLTLRFAAGSRTGTPTPVEPSHST